MAISDNNGGGLTAADVAAVMGNNGYGNGWGGFGGDGAWWLLVLFLFAFGNNGWGNGFGGGNGSVPYLMNSTTNSDIQRGFDQQTVMNGINGLTSAVSSGFANAEVSRCNAQTNLLQALNANQAATISGMNSLAMGLQNCCCENRAAVADLKYNIATENAADRVAVNNATRDIIANQTAASQMILDKLCQQEIDALKTQNANLQTQINLATLRESQTAQTAQILADNAAQTTALEQYLNPAPIPAYMVQNPNCCSQYTGCCNS